MKHLSPSLIALFCSVGAAVWGQSPSSAKRTSSAVETTSETVRIQGQKNNNQRGAARPGQVFRGTGNSYWAAAPPEGGGATSVITFGEADQKTIDETGEDLKILSYLLSRSLERAFATVAPDYKLGIPMLVTSEGHTVQAYYVGGFGAVLTLRVGFPVVAAAGEEKAPETPEPASEWDEARRAVNEGDAPQGFPGQVPSQRFTFSNEEAVPYDAKLVETLKRRIIALLKNASNFRHVKSDEWLVVSVTGRPNSSWQGGLGGRDGGLLSESPNPKRTGAAPTAPHNKNALSKPSPAPEGSAEENVDPAGDADTPTWATGPHVSNRATMMTIRIKKSAADAFAAGKITKEDFTKEAEITTYLGAPTTTRAMARFNVMRK